MLTLLSVQDLERSSLALPSLQLESSCQAQLQMGLHIQSCWVCSLHLVAPLGQLKPGKATWQQPCFIAVWVALKCCVVNPHPIYFPSALHASLCVSIQTKTATVMEIYSITYSALTSWCQSNPRINNWFAHLWKQCQAGEVFANFVLCVPYLSGSQTICAQHKTQRM